MAKKEEEPLHIDLAEQNGAAQREAKVSNKNVPVFEGKAYLFCLYQVMEMAKRFGGAKQKCLQRIRSQVPHYCWISWTYKAIFAGPIFTWGNQRNRQKKRRK